MTRDSRDFSKPRRRRKRRISKTYALIGVITGFVLLGVFIVTFDPFGSGVYESDVQRLQDDRGQTQLTSGEDAGKRRTKQQRIEAFRKNNEVMHKRISSGLVNQGQADFEVAYFIEDEKTNDYVADVLRDMTKFLVYEEKEAIFVGYPTEREGYDSLVKVLDEVNLLKSGDYTTNQNEWPNGCPWNPTEAYDEDPKHKFWKAKDKQRYQVNPHDFLIPQLRRLGVCEVVCLQGDDQPPSKTFSLLPWTDMHLDHQGEGITKIQDYYGARVARYWEFMVHYCKWLSGLALGAMFMKWLYHAEASQGNIDFLNQEALNSDVIVASGGNIRDYYADRLQKWPVIFWSLGVVIWGLLFTSDYFMKSGSAFQKAPKDDKPISYTQEDLQDQRQKKQQELDKFNTELEKKGITPVKQIKKTFWQRYWKSFAYSGSFLLFCGFVQLTSLAFQGYIVGPDLTKGETGGLLFKIQNAPWRAIEWLMKKSYELVGASYTEGAWHAQPVQDAGRWIRGCQPTSWNDTAANTATGFKSQFFKQVNAPCTMNPDITTGSLAHIWQFIRELIPTICHVCTIMTLNFKYQDMAKELTDDEEHDGASTAEIEQKEYNSMVMKRFCFEQFDTYLIPLWVLSKRKMYFLNVEVYAVFFVDQIRRIFCETIIPWVTMWYYARQSKQKEREEDKAAGVTQDSSLLDSAQKQKEKMEHEDFDDFLEMSNTLGMLLFFPYVFFKGPILAAIYIWMEMTSDGYRVTNIEQRPEPKHSMDLGIWHWCFKVTAYLAIFVNMFAFGPVIQGHLTDLLGWMGASKWLGLEESVLPKILFGVLTSVMVCLAYCQLHKTYRERGKGTNPIGVLQQQHAV